MFCSFSFNSLPRRIAVIFCAAFIIVLLFYPALCGEGIKSGIRLCYTILIPSLFPFLFASDYLFALLSYSLPAKSNSSLKLASAVFLGLAGGFPTGAKAVGDMCAQKALDKKQSALLLCGCVNAGPAFLISGIGQGLFKSATSGFYLFVSLTLASIIIVSFNYFCFIKSSSVTQCRLDNQSFPELGASLDFALKSMLSICSYVLLFSCVSGVMDELLFSQNSDSPVAWLVFSLLEVSTGCSRAHVVGGDLGLYFACASVSLCGLSVILQVRSLISTKGISIKPFLLSRLFHLPLSLLILKLLLSLAPSSEQVLFSLADKTACLFSFSPLLSFFMLLMSVILIAGRRLPY
ncbi:MAG: hypothetical protein RSE36_02780 [Oscillospiraceae bacterium]